MTTERRTRKDSLRNLSFILILILAGGGYLLLQSEDMTQALLGTPRLGKGKEAPAFTLANLQGQSVQLSDYQGKVVFLNIWATWCPPCVEEMPSMEQLHHQLKDEPFAILAVSVDTDGPQAVGPFMKKHNLTFTALVDPKGSMKYLYQTTGVPESYIIGPDGVIIEKIVGPRNWASPEVVQYFRDLMRQSVPS